MTSTYRKEGSRLYLFSIVLVAIIGGLLFGYDTAVVSGAEKALEEFFRSGLGDAYTKAWHGFTASSALLGCVVGGAISGFMASQLGRKRSLIAAAAMFFVSAVGSWRPESALLPYGEPSMALLALFNFYRVLGGVGVGLASAVCPMYIAEIAPARIRGTLVSCNQFAIIFGMLVVYFVNYLIRDSLGDTAETIRTAMTAIGWRRMFLSEAFPAGAFFLLIMLVPETPRFLALKGRDAKAFAVLARINGTAEAGTILADIRATVHERHEKLLTYGGAVIVIGILLSFFQQAVGINVVLYYAPRIFENMGATGDASMMQTVVMGIVNIVFTVVAIFTVDKVGRKPLLIVGSTGMMVGMIALAALSFSDAIGTAARGEHHGLQRLVHVQLGPDLLGADRRDLPQHDPLAGRGHRRRGAMDRQLPRLGDLSVVERMERRGHLLHLCLHVARFGGVRLAPGARDQRPDAGGDVAALAQIAESERKRPPARSHVSEAVVYPLRQHLRYSGSPSSATQASSSSRRARGVTLRRSTVI